MFIIVRQIEITTTLIVFQANKTKPLITTVLAIEFNTITFLSNADYHK